MPPIDFQAVVRQAERTIVDQTDVDELVNGYFAATAGTRPAVDQPGTYGQQLAVVNLFLHLPVELRRRYRRRSWRACLDHSLLHRRPLEEQARRWAREQARPAQPKPARPQAKPPAVKVHFDD